MGRSTLTALFVAASAIGCNHGVDGLVSRPDGGIVCQNNESICPTGTRCTNGVCQQTCTGGTSCGNGNYCEGPAAPVDVCAPDQVHACQYDIQCPLPQSCNYGLCASLETAVDGGQACNFRGYPEDGCKPDALCSFTDFGLICIALAACSQDGGCVGQADQAGFVCNQLADGGFIVPGKERVCLSGHCLHASDCGGGQNCYIPPTGPLGDCQYGIEGDPCTTYADCETGRYCNGTACTACPAPADAGPGALLPDGGSVCN